MLIMLDTLMRSFLRHDAFDRAMLVIELLVLFIIGFEAVVHAWGHFKVAHRLKHVRARFAEGQELQRNAPQLGARSEDVTRWVMNVDAWVNATNRLLTGYSYQASASFLHDPGHMFRLVTAHQIASAAESPYAQLQDRLNNLKRIIETPNVYL